MKRLSDLPDEMLLKILSFLPAKDVLATMVLSKRWQSLWKMVPKLFYDDSYHQDIEYKTFFGFVEKSFVEARALDTLHLKLGKRCDSKDLEKWVTVADKCSPHQLIVEVDSSSTLYPVTLPRRLYTGCTILVSLKLNQVMILEGVHSDSVVSFPSLRTLVLLAVKYPADGFIEKFLSSCPVLEDLTVERPPDTENIFIVNVASLRRLLLRLAPQIYDKTRGFEIHTPSLEFLDILDHRSGFCKFVNDLPNIIKAVIDVHYRHPENMLRSITSVKQLDLCLPFSEESYGCVFHYLLHLKICTCGRNWLNLLMCLLRDSPKLQSLKIDQCHPLRDEEPRPYWINPSYVPESILSSLQTLEWLKYEGSKEERELVAFILRTGSNLKTVIISSLSTDLAKKLEMSRELMLLSRGSPNCEFVFK